MSRLRASALVEFYRRHRQGTWIRRRLVYVVARILSDLRHLCDKHEIDWHEVEEVQDRHYRDDQGEF